MSSLISALSAQQLLGSGRATENLRRDLELAVRSDARVLLTGEAGLGKEAVARFIHQQSRRRAAPFLAINCAGVPDSLLQPVLQEADHGTVFLDEVGELTPRLQDVLRRFLEKGEVLGSTDGSAAVDVRVIVATSDDLAARAHAGDFGIDLYYRLNVLRIDMPPVRERRNHLPAPARYDATASRRN